MILSGLVCFTVYQHFPLPTSAVFIVAYRSSALKVRDRNVFLRIQRYRHSYGLYTNGSIWTYVKKQTGKANVFPLVDVNFSTQGCNHEFLKSTNQRGACKDWIEKGTFQKLSKVFEHTKDCETAISYWFTNIAVKDGRFL